jgi:glutaryl-CoA dehydrogenase
MATERKDVKQPKPLPAPNSNFYELAETLPAEDLAMVKQVRAFMETKVAPIITKYWVDDAFPFELLPSLKELNIGGIGMTGYGCRGGSALLFGLVAMEMARFDASIATFFGVHNGLAMGSIYLDGSEEQKQLLRGHVPDENLIVGKAITGLSAFVQANLRRINLTKMERFLCREKLQTSCGKCWRAPGLSAVMGLLETR